MKRVKYNRTYHLPFSRTVAADDKMHPNPSIFEGRNLIVTLKMDGENTALYQDGYTHARSVDSRGHESRDWLKKFWAERHYLLPHGYRVYGENLYAKHSIHYHFLTSYFQVFAIYDDRDIRLDWDKMQQLCEDLDMVMVETVATTTTLSDVEKAFIDAINGGDEGIVVTTHEGFNFDEMSTYTAKAVRANHVQTNEHWIHGEVIKNGTVTLIHI